MADFADIVVSKTNGIGTVRLNRPRRGNSVTPDVVTRMGDAVGELAETDGVDAIVLTGTGKVFCAGADVQEMFCVYTADGADGLMTYLSETWMPAVQQTVRRLWYASAPVIAAYNGAATAGGLDFGLACDLRLAADSARFAESYVNLGMIPVAGGAFLLPTLIGQAAAARMIGMGTFVGAQEALRLGLVEEIHPADELGDRAHQLAISMTRGPAATYSKAKSVMRAAHTPGLEDALDRSLTANVELLARQEVRESVLAVMERFSLSHSG